MTQYTFISRDSSLRIVRAILALLVVTFIAVGIAVAIYAPSRADAAYVAALGVGSSGSSVSQLQSFLSKDDAIYPQGLVTGYYGALTQAAVMRFQCSNGIVCSGSASTTGYGRVGPMTNAKLNELTVSADPADVVAPTISPLSVTSGQNFVTVSWSTSEPTKGFVMYGLSYPFLHISASRVMSTSIGTSHSVTISGLSANTNYSFVIKSIDLSGNVSLTLANSVHTQQ